MSELQTEDEARGADEAAEQAVAPAEDEAPAAPAAPEPSPLDGARAAVIAGCERLGEAARSTDLDFVRGQLADLRGVVSRIDPRALTPRGGLAGLFDSPKKRLRRFRETVIDSAPAVSTAAVKLRDAAAGMGRRGESLSAGHQTLRERLAELDAALADFAASDAALADERPLNELVDRLDSETRAGHDPLRAAALGHLPLARMVQNVDSRLADAVSAAAEAAAAWRDQMLQALGAEGKKLKPLRKIRPDQGALSQTCDALLAVLDRLDAALNEARARRDDVMARMDRALDRVRAG